MARFALRVRLVIMTIMMLSGGQGSAPCSFTGRWRSSAAR
jgi:hypothetical protein